jgi:nitrate reductase gamma subunit
MEGGIGRMGALISLVAVAGLALLAVVAASAGSSLRFALGVIVPGVAFAVFLGGIIYRVVRWGKAPVPFRVPTTTGQAKSLSWIRNNELEAPSGVVGVIGRMALEVLFFRSLFRNTRVELLPGKEKVSYLADKTLWAAAMAFHWTMFVIILRHFRFFIEPVPVWVEALQSLDGFFQIGLPVIYLSTGLFIVALGYLLARRFFDRKVQYISLPSDYFALYLLLGIGLSGFLMRHLEKVDVVQVKAAIAGWASFQPVAPVGVGVWYFVHVGLVSALLVYFPFSKLLHAPGVFLSPTRNLANSNRARRHINPWNPDISGHTYAEWEDEFRDKLKASGYALEKE